MFDIEIQYEVWCPDRGQEKGDGYNIAATSPVRAAEQYAEISDWKSAEFAIARGDGVYVEVWNPVKKETKTYFVSAEERPVYYAKEVKKL